MAATSIEWTDATWNPVTGCDLVSPGCDHCFALTLAKRLKAMGSPHYQLDGDPRTSGPGFGVQCHADALDIPLHWRKPRRIFVCSMADLFHQDVPYRFIREVFNTMRNCNGTADADGVTRLPSHTFQVLTKRPQRMKELALTRALGFDPERPPSNIMMGTSIELDRFTFRADHLRATPATVRFLSLEPLLGPLPSLDLTGIDWVIVGAESGQGARPMGNDWVRDIRDRCTEGNSCPDCSGSGGAVWLDPDGQPDGAKCERCDGRGRISIPLFVKQLTGTRKGSVIKDMDLFPADLRIREYPS